MNNPILKSLFALALVHALVLTCVLLEATTSSTIPFDTDEADHANAALEIYHADTPGEAIQGIVRQSFYPPLHPLNLTLSYAALGVSLASSRLPSVLFFALHLGLLFFLTRRTCRRISAPHATAAGSVTLLLAAACPIVVSTSSLCMLEALGVLLVSGLLFSLAEPEKSRGQTVIVAWVLTTLLFLTKYSFGIFVFPALALTFLAPYRSAAPLAIRARACGFYVFATLAGLSLWILLTDHHSAWQFIVGHPSYAPFWSVKNLLFHPHAWLTAYATDPVTACVAGLLATIGGVRHWKLLSVRFATLLVAINFAVVTVSTTNEQRYMLILAPAAWYLAGIGSLEAWAWIRRKSTERPVVVAGCLSLLLLNAAYWAGHQIAGLPESLQRNFEGEPEYTVLQDQILGHIDPSKPVLVVGAFDQFGTEALRWKFAAAAGIRYSEVRVDRYPFAEIFRDRAKVRRRNLAYPWTDEAFPRQPLAATLRRGHYQHLIHIQREDRKPGRFEPSTQDATTLESCGSLELAAGATRISLCQTGNGLPDLPAIQE